MTRENFKTPVCEWEDAAHIIAWATMSGVDQTFSLEIFFVVAKWVTLLTTWLTRSSWLQYSGATQVQLESEVGRTITPANAMTQV